MEYSRSFALVEAIALVGLTAWLFYINSLGSGGGSSREDADETDEKGGHDQGDKP